MKIEEPINHVFKIRCLPEQFIYNTNEIIKLFSCLNRKILSITFEYDENILTLKIIECDEREFLKTKGEK